MDASIEKAETPVHLEKREDTSTNEEPFEPLTEEEHRKLTRKIDFHLIPFLSLLYLLSFLDRTAIGNAKTFGIEKSLGLTDTQYLIALTVFFITYSLFEPVSNVLLRRFRPSHLIPATMILWGIVMAFTGVIKNYGQLIAMRLLLGIFEAPLFPGAVAILACWYTRKQYGLRASIFFSAATASGAFGGLVSVGLSKINVRGYGQWEFIFIVYGALTVAVALVAPWLVHDYPSNSKFLNEREKKGLILRLQAGSMESAGGEAFSWHALGTAFKDWKTYVACAIYAGVDMPLYAFSLFLPSIIRQLGYTSVKANLLSVPIYVFACILTVGVGFAADRTGKRFIFNFGCMAVGAIGYILLISVQTPGVKYFAVYMAASGIYPCIPNTIAWVSNNTEGSYKRHLVLGLTIAFGNLNGAVSSNVYRARDLPSYRLGHGLVLLYVAIGLVGSAVYAFFLSRENAARDRGERDEIIDSNLAPGEFNKAFNNRTFSSVHEAKMVLGDRHSSYRYII